MMETMKKTESIIFTMQEAAESLGVCPNTLRKMIKAGRIPVLELSEGRRGISKQAIYDFVNGKLS